MVIQVMAGKQLCVLFFLQCFVVNPLFGSLLRLIYIVLEFTLRLTGMGLLSSLSSQALANAAD